MLHTLQIVATPVAMLQSRDMSPLRRSPNSPIPKALFSSASAQLEAILHAKLCTHMRGASHRLCLPATSSRRVPALVVATACASYNLFQLQRRLTSLPAGATYNNKGQNDFIAYFFLQVQVQSEQARSGGCQTAQQGGPADGQHPA